MPRGTRKSNGSCLLWGAAPGPHVKMIVSATRDWEMQRLISIGRLGILAIPLLAPTGYAQSGAPVEQVVVTGIRMSVGKSVETKRALDVVADVITAEDVGKLPDKNVAEALQRVTGVQITRDSNEGKFVNVRGLPSEFNYVTL